MSALTMSSAPDFTTPPPMFQEPSPFASTSRLQTFGTGFGFLAASAGVVGAASATAVTAISAVRRRMGDSAGVEVVEAVFYEVEPRASPKGLREFPQRVKLVTPPHGGG